MLEKDPILPEGLNHMEDATREARFSMGSDYKTGSLLRALVASKPSGSFLELGTGTGLGTRWILDGMDKESSLISVENDDIMSKVANSFLSQDKRLKIVVEDAAKFLKRQSPESFDLIFADAWPGKYFDLDIALSLLKQGGFYVVDDMLPNPIWTDEHGTKARELVSQLKELPEFHCLTLDWSTGLIVLVKKVL